MNGAFPPSSKEHFFKVELASRMSSFPTRVEPVNDIFLIVGCVQIVCPTASIFLFDAVTTFKTPAGTPACSASSAKASAEKGVSAAGLMTTEQPAAIA